MYSKWPQTVEHIGYIGKYIGKYVGKYTRMGIQEHACSNCALVRIPFKKGYLNSAKQKQGSNWLNSKYIT